MYIAENSTTTTRHKYAGIWKRTFARILDMLLLSVVAFLICLLCFVGNFNELFVKWTDTTRLDSWRVFLAIMIATFLTFFYFYIIPYITKGYTAFKKIFKIRMYTNEKHKNFFWLIFKHEFLITFFILLINIMFAIIVISTNQPIKAIKFVVMFDFEPTKDAAGTIIYDPSQDIKNNLNIAIPSFFVKAGYIISGFIPMVLFFYMWFHKNKLALQDIISQTFVYCLEEYVPQVVVTSEVIEQDNSSQSVLAPGLSKTIAKGKSQSNQQVDNLEDLSKYSSLYDSESRSLLDNLEQRRKEFEDSQEQNNQ